MNSKAIKKVRNFIATNESLDFAERLILLRIINELNKEDGVKPEQSLEVILLKLRYKAKQTVPEEWIKILTVPTEIEMSGELVDEPVDKMHIVKKSKRPMKTLNAVNRWENKARVEPVGAKLVVL